MEIEVVEQGKNHLRLKVKGENHTFCNALVKELWQDKDTEIAGYEIPHSLTEDPILTLHTKKDPVKALNEAADRLKKQNKELATKFAAIMK